MSDTATASRMPEILAPDQVGVIERAEIDVAVATAHKYPRSLQQFNHELGSYIRTDPEFCEQAYYSLERGGKLIQGPSVRFAEVVNYCWRNTMVGVRFVGETGDGRFALVQAVGFDLERGTRYSEEVARRVVDKHGERYSDDMVQTTIRAASAIARREIYLRMTPAVVYRGHFKAAQAVVVGADLDHEGRIAKLADRAKSIGVTRNHLLSKAGKRKLADLHEKDLLHLWGFLNAIDDGMLSLADAFPSTEAPTAADLVDAARGQDDDTTTNDNNGSEG